MSHQRVEPLHRLFRSGAWGLLGLCLVGCTEAKNRGPQPPRYTEHLVCLVEDPERLQHMFRLDLATARAEFVGGFGGRITSLNSNRLVITPSEVLINFVNESVQPSSGFEVRIERVQLSYELVFEEGQKTGQPTLTGRCSVLDGEQLRASTQNLLLSLYSSKQSKQPLGNPNSQFKSKGSRGADPTYRSAKISTQAMPNMMTTAN